MKGHRVVSHVGVCQRSVDGYYRECRFTNFGTCHDFVYAPHQEGHGHEGERAEEGRRCGGQVSGAFR